MNRWTTVVAISLLATACTLGAVSVALAGEPLAVGSGCMNCHNLNKRLVGPSFKEIAAANVTKDGARVILAGKILNGSTGSWGAIPMPPNSVSQADAESLAKWILTVK